MTQPVWVWDDPHIADGATSADRISFTVLDILTGEQVINPAALSYDRGDGLSIYREELLRSEYVADVSAVCENWATHGVAAFRAGDVRHVPSARAGINDYEDTDDARIGRAHAVVRCPDPETGHQKVNWNPIRAAIADKARWIEG